MFNAVHLLWSRANGIVFDRPETIISAEMVKESVFREIQTRVQFTAGDFFVTVPEGADLYLVKHVLHNWNDDQCVTILTNIRRVMDKNGKVCIA